MIPLDPQIKVIWTLRFILNWFLAVIAIFVLELILPNRLPEIVFLPFGVTTLIALLLVIISGIIYPQLKYKYWKFEIRQQEIYIERGILTRIKTIAPYRRVQHLDVQQGILERLMGLAMLVIYTAGTRGADITIPGLPLEYAEALRDQLKNYTLEDAV
jgi:uncharacterized protein